MSVQKTGLCMSSATSQGSRRLTHVCSVVCCVSSPAVAAKASWETQLLSRVLKELMCLQIVSDWNFTRDQSLGPSDSLLSASGLVHTLCIYLKQMKEAGPNESISLSWNIFHSAPNWHSGRLSMFSTMPLVTCFWDSYFCALFWISCE